MIDRLINGYESVVSKVQIFDGVPALFMRLVLAPVMIIAGYKKLGISNPDASFGEMFLADPSIVNWFGNPEWGLGLPFPELMGFLAGWTEFLGGWFLLIGFMTRFVSIPLMFTMIVAVTSVHWENGWFAVASSSADTSPAQVFHWLGFEAAEKSLAEAPEVAERLSAMRSILSEHGYPEWLYEKGSIVVLNNGIEFAAIYFIMLLSLFFVGGGRFVSVDFYLKQFVFR